MAATKLPWNRSWRSSWTHRSSWNFLTSVHHNLCKGFTEKTILSLSTYSVCDEKVKMWLWSLIGNNRSQLSKSTKPEKNDGGCSHRSNQNWIMLAKVYNYAGNGAKILCELIIIIIFNKNQYLTVICTLNFFFIWTRRNYFSATGGKILFKYRELQESALGTESFSATHNFHVISHLWLRISAESSIMIRSDWLLAPSIFLFHQALPRIIIQSFSMSGTSSCSLSKHRYQYLSTGTFSSAGAMRSDSRCRCWKLNEYIKIAVERNIQLLCQGYTYFYKFRR